MSEAEVSTALPELAISLRQPWAWAVIYAGKDIENRTVKAISYMTPLRGRRAIHAAKGMTREEYFDAREFMDSLGIQCPPPHELQRGGVIGSIAVLGVAKQSESVWWFGPRGLVLADPRPCEFIPSVGALGYFRWKPADESIVPRPARWMLPKDRSIEPHRGDDCEPDLFGDREAAIA